MAKENNYDQREKENKIIRTILFIHFYFNPTVYLPTIFKIQNAKYFLILKIMQTAILLEISSLSSLIFLWDIYYKVFHVSHIQSWNLIMLFCLIGNLLWKNSIPCFMRQKHVTRGRKGCEFFNILQKTQKRFWGILSGKTYRGIQAANENPEIDVFVFKFLDERMILEAQRELFNEIMITNRSFMAWN